MRLDRVFHQFQLFFLDFVGAQQVDRLHQFGHFGIPDFVPRARTQFHAVPEAPAPGFGVDQGLAFVVVFDEQGFEFFRRHFKRHQHFVHEAHDQVDDAFFFLAVLEFRCIFGIFAPHARQPFGRHDRFRADGHGRQIAVQHIHGHGIFGAPVRQQELV
ncbi:hypothetical protein D3C81_1547820 [compost metagenome]